MTTNDTQALSVTDEQVTITIGDELKSRREAEGLTVSAVAARLRLSEKIIRLIEANEFPGKTPSTFMRGYIRAYGKLLNIPEEEVKAALKPLQPLLAPLALPQTASRTPYASESYSMQLVTFLIMFTMLGLVGMWWHGHSSPSTTPTSLSNNETNKDLSFSDKATSILKGTTIDNKVESAKATAATAPNQDVSINKQAAETVANSSEADMDAALNNETNKAPSVAMLNQSKSTNPEEAIYGDGPDAEEQNNTTME